MKKIAFLTTIFPMQENYLIDFLNSLINQTIKEFDLIFVNDGYKNFDLLKDEYSALNIIEIIGLSNIAKNREIGINYCIDNKYDILIFGDSDDYFEKNRIEKSLELLNNYDIVVNDLNLFDENGVYEEKYISNRLENLCEVDFEFIKDKNIFGMTNTAIKLENIYKVTFDDKIVAVDWYFFKTLLMQGLKAIFTNETLSFYRQYENNTVGLSVEGNTYYLWWEKK